MSVRYLASAVALSAVLMTGGCTVYTHTRPVNSSASVQVQYQQPSVMVVGQAPPAPHEAALQPPAPSANAIWVAGYWNWTGQWVWQPGQWVSGRSGQVWEPPVCVATGRGYEYYPGHFRPQGSTPPPAYRSRNTIRVVATPAQRGTVVVNSQPAARGTVVVNSQPARGTGVVAQPAQPARGTVVVAQPAQPARGTVVVNSTPTRGSTTVVAPSRGTTTVATPAVRGSTTRGTTTVATPAVRGSTTTGTTVTATPAVRGSTTTGGTVTATPAVRGSTTTGATITATPAVRGSTTTGATVAAQPRVTPTTTVTRPAAGRTVAQPTVPARPTATATPRVTPTVDNRPQRTNPAVVAPRPTTTTTARPTTTTTVTRPAAGRTVGQTTLPARTPPTPDDNRPQATAVRCSPAIARVPRNGRVVLRGSGLAEVSRVRVGGQAAPIVRRSDTEINASLTGNGGAIVIDLTSGQQVSCGSIEVM